LLQELTEATAKTRKSPDVNNRYALKGGSSNG